MRLTLMLCCFAVQYCSAQTLYLQVENDEKINKNWSDKKFASRNLRDDAITKIYNEIVSQGYLDTQIDTISQDSTLILRISKGDKYLMGESRWIGDTLLSSRIQSQIQSKKNTPFNTLGIQENFESILQYMENNGHPFAKIEIQNIDLKNPSINFEYSINPGPTIFMDSLVIKTGDKMPSKYIKNYLGIRNKDLYSEETLNNLSKKIREIPFITITKNPELLFKDNRALLFIYLKRKKANYFNGILGIRPNDKTGRVNLTGDVEIKLLSAFNSGEEIYLNWRRLQLQTQDLTAKLVLPYLFNLPLGTEGQLKIYKRDSTFTSMKSSFALVFQMGKGNTLKTFAEKNVTNQIGSGNYSNALANVNTSIYGLGINFSQLDYRFNPRRGYAIQWNGGVGKRGVTKPTADLGNVALETKKGLYKMEGVIDGYIPTWSKQCIRLSLNGGGYFASPIFDNEMFRIGGLRTVRGINEEEIFASSWSVGTFEYRYLLDENSALYVFYDQAWYEKKGQTNFVTDIPHGFGAGVNFDTKAGIFTFNYALSQQFDNPLLIRNAKISFGFRNIF